ncbi:TonB-dependent receptor [Sphingobium sp. BYY-5]|uniref:TonB-dependent receptor n=1 Tax=Sphingobium sp. BYY-5 TaxID=2926400 RepID=UPI001FA73315|nr:TonB-dependent receptor [Sphingobium sp. BYY-5]MCI4590732.1 TonB-dependent receptor [Sphingobium sp. BYY-5]
MRFRYTRINQLAIALLGGSMLSSAPVWAQSAPGDAVSQAASASAAIDQSVSAQSGDEALDSTPSDNNIVVTGFRQSYANAIASKRAQISITDGISSDGLGRFPDLNVGEALQRVPGVQINREAEGRNATINLRGLPGEYARLTLNGVAFAEPILSEAAPLGAFNSDIFSAIIVEKSPLANAQSGGLSGNVDLQIASALSRKEGGFAKASYEYNELGERGAPGATIGYNHHFSDDFAVFGTFAYKQENFRRDSILFNSYTAMSPEQAQANAALVGGYYAPSAGCPSCTGTQSTAGVLYNSQLRQYSRLNKGNLYSAAAGAEYRISDSAKIGLTGFLTDRKQPKTLQYIMVNSLNTASSITALSAPVSLSDGRYVVNDFDYANPTAVSSTREYGQHQKAWGINANGEWKNDDWRVNAIGTLSQASNSSIETEVDFETMQAAGGNGLTGTMRTGGGNLNNFAYTINPVPATSAAGISSGVWGGVADPTYFYDSAIPAAQRNRMQFTGTQSYATNKLAAAQFEVERTLHGFLTGIQAGMRYEHNQFISRGYRTSAYGLQVQNLTGDVMMQSPTYDDFFGGNGGTPTGNWQVTDLNKFLSQVTPITVYPGGDLSPLGYNIRYNDNSYSLYNFTNENNIFAAYGQLKYEFELGGITVRGNGGLRYERTNNIINALNRVSLTNSIGSPSDFVNTTYKQHYNKLLPSFIAVAEISDKLLVRAAAYRTYVRPQPRAFTPVTIVSAPSNGVYSVTLGNPDLKPYNATSFDISAEFYNRPNGIISLAGFQKRITGLISQITDPTQLCPSDASALGLGTLTVNGDRCESSLTYTQGGVTQPYLVSASGFMNQTNPITVRGLEFNIQQTLDFLPGILKNLGGGFNYAYTTISGKTATGAKATLPGVSKHNANLIGYYETPDYGVRLVYNVRSKYDLASAGTFTGAARQVRARGQLDASASYNITSFLTLSVDAYNLTNAIRYEYENQPDLPRRYDYDGRTYSVTLRGTF